MPLFFHLIVDMSTKVQHIRQLTLAMLLPLVDNVHIMPGHQAVDSGKVVAFLKALVHFSAKLSLSAQKTIGSSPDLESWNTSPGDIPS